MVSNKQTLAIRDAFMDLLRAGLWAKMPALPSSLTADDWAQIYVEACRQTVVGVLYDAVCRLPETCRAQMSPDLWNAWHAHVLHVEKTWHSHLLSINYLSARCLMARLEPVVVKGLALAEYYPNPKHRETGDIDLFYGSAEQTQQASKVVAGWGVPVHESNGDAVYTLNGIVIEHHARLIETGQLRSGTLQKEIEEAYFSGKVVRETQIGGSAIHVLQPEYEGLLLFSHSYKHLLNEGIGFRQLCDVAMFMSRHGKALQESGLMLNLLIRFGMKKWADCVLCFCVSYLGLPEANLPYKLDVTKKNATNLLAEVWRSGNFGALSGRRKLLQSNALVCKIRTACQISRNVFLYGHYAPSEAFGVYVKSVIWSLRTLLVKSKS